MVAGARHRAVQGHTEFDDAMVLRTFVSARLFKAREKTLGITDEKGGSDWR
jgi:hypothetical protein